MGYSLGHSRHGSFGSTPRPLALREAVDVVGLVAWLHKDAQIKRLDAKIDSEADDGAALSHEVRRQRDAEAQADLLAIERDEAALVFRAQSEGLPVEHRAHIGPVALLGLRLVTTARVNQTPGTTPEYSWPMRR